MKILGNRNEFRFLLDNEFKGEYLTPIIDNLKDKYISAFDDYNEVYHANKLIQTILKSDNIKLDCHLLKRNDELLGVAFVSHHGFDKALFFNNCSYAFKDKAVVLNYFHISNEGRGNGRYWLEKLIIPYYREQEYEYMYLKSSHSRAFTMYEDLGKSVENYSCNSDNNLFIRNGQIFEIDL